MEPGVSATSAEACVQNITREDLPPGIPEEDSTDFTGTDGLAFNAWQLGPNIGRNVRVSTAEQNAICILPANKHAAFYVLCVASKVASRSFSHGP